MTPSEQRLQQAAPEMLDILKAILECNGLTFTDMTESGHYLRSGFLTGIALRAAAVVERIEGKEKG